MTKARTLANVLSDGSILADGIITATEIADGNLAITSGSVRLHGNYPVGINNVQLGVGALNPSR